MSINLSTDMDSIFLGTENPFREAVTYTPSGLPARQIYAQVERQAPVELRPSGSGEIHKHRVEIWVSKTDLPTVTPMTDMVAITESGVSKTKRVASVLYEDSGSYKLGLA